jgi:hypothetical protein
MESVNAVSVAEYTHTMMSMKFIFMFIIKAYKFNKERDESFGSNHFCHLIQTLGDFLRKINGSKMLHSQAFKALFDVDTLNIISEIVPGVIIVDILKDILKENDAKSRDCNFLNAVGEILISDIFFDDASQQIIFRFAVKLVSCQFPDSFEEYDASFVKGPIKERTLGLIRNLYEVCTKIENGKIRANYLKTLTIEIVPHLIKVIAVNCSDLIHHNNILEEILLTTLMPEISGNALKNLLKQENSDLMFDKLFKIIQRSSSCQHLPENYQLSMIAYKQLVGFFQNINNEGILNVAN